ncbi:Noranthrone monooxygenase [Ascochyta lentis]
MVSLESVFVPAAAFASAFLAGGMNVVSTLTIPLILTSTPPDLSLLLRQWYFVYDSGHKIGPRLAVTSGLIYWSAAWASRDRARAFALYASSGALTMSMVPFTWLFILDINNAIFAEIEKDRAGNRTNLAHAQHLIAKWRTLNMVRTVFPVLGAALGMMTLCGLVR